MKRMHWVLIGCLGAAITSCQTSSSMDQVVSQTFVHKYGFDVSEKEWEQRDQDGQVVTVLKNGVKITYSYDNGQLHGPTTHTFPNSNVVEKLLVYDQGNLLKQMTNDVNGMPIREEIYEFDDRTITTLWDDKGAPLSIEEYDDEILVEGKYYTSGHELEAQVEGGFGERVMRDRSGLLVERGTVENGVIASRMTYHPSGQTHTVSHYHDYQLHGEQLKYTTAGKPLMKLNWNHGVLDGLKIVFRNGYKVAEIPYIEGQKHGTELHYDDMGNLTAEVQWRNDKKHGSSKFYNEETNETEWFFNGQTVSADKFQSLDSREKIIAEFSAD
ncbi:MAG TPA: toxin-antitoxin system YwqK family antitoxin [Chlamydiales bacterium]|nr:toxin-antitoxin system YwqK family antitoxin [Chlamydiales bacterium]